MNPVRRHLTRIGLFAAVVVGLLAPGLAAAQGIFLHAGTNFPGTSLDPDHKEWIDLVSVDHGIRRVARQGGNGTRAHPGVVEVVKRADAASPLLLQSGTDGKALPVVVLEFVGANPDQTRRTRFHRIALSNVVVIDVRMDIAVHGNTNVTHEKVRLEYTSGAWTYTEVDATGEPLRDRSLAWDFLREEGGFWSERLQEFRVSGSFQPGGRLGVRWQAESGRRYQILRPLNWIEPAQFQMVAEIAAGAAGERTFEVPASQALDLFLVRELE